MAKAATPLRLELELADADRGVQERLVVATARHPSETAERVWLRILAFAWQWQPGMEFGAGGVSDPDDPDIFARDATGVWSAVVFVGKPEPRRVLRVRSKAPSARAAILFESADRLAAFARACEADELTKRVADVERAAIDPELLRQLAVWDGRRMQVSVTLSGDMFYVARGDVVLTGGLSR